jgi:hypothetical protein
MGRTLAASRDADRAPGQRSVTLVTVREGRVYHLYRHVDGLLAIKPRAARSGWRVPASSQ